MAQRKDAHDDIDRYKDVFVGLYSPDASRTEPFDVALASPRRGRPANLISFTGLLDEIEKSYLRRAPTGPYLARAVARTWRSSPRESRCSLDGCRLARVALIMRAGRRRMPAG